MGMSERRRVDYMCMGSIVEKDEATQDVQNTDSKHERLGVAVDLRPTTKHGSC